MNYYQLLEPHVTKFVTSFLTDFTQHDAKELDGYTGEFIYTYRSTGTFIVRIDTLFNALNEVLQTGQSTYFGQKGIEELKRGTLRFNDLYQACGVKQSAQEMIRWEYNNQWKKYFIYGRNGKIRHVSAKKMLEMIEFYSSRMDAIVNQIHQKHINRSAA